MFGFLLGFKARLWAAGAIIAALFLAVLTIYQKGRVAGAAKVKAQAKVAYDKAIEERKKINDEVSGMSRTDAREWLRQHRLRED